MNYVPLALVMLIGCGWWAWQLILTRRDTKSRREMVKAAVRSSSEMQRRDHAASDWDGKKYGAPRDFVFTREKIEGLAKIYGVKPEQLVLPPCGLKSCTGCYTCPQLKRAPIEDLDV